MTAPFVRVRPDLLARLYSEPPTVGRRYSMPLVAVTVAGLADRALRPCDGQDFPTIGELSRVVGWSTTAVSNLLTDPDRWCHADSVEAWRRYWTFTAAARLPKKRAVEVASPVILGCDSVVTDLSVGAGSTDVLAVKVVTRLPLTCRSVATRKLYARGSRGRARTDLQTNRPSENKEHTAPVPVADLFTAPPDSQPDAEPMDSADESTTLPPVAAAPLPADVLAVVAVLAKLNQRSAERMTRGTNEGIVKATRKAIKALGLPRLLARLEYVAARQDTDDMRFWRETLARKLAPLLTLDGPWVRGLDEAAAESAEQNAPEPITAPNTPPAEISEAAAAWASMTFRHEWRLLDRGGVPKRPEDANRDDTPGVVFADEPAEHVRRWHAYRAAGGTKAWREVRGEADRMAFRDAFKAAYESGVISE